ncbi:MAG: hypothetical protein ACI87J_002254 [Colwellia sp.]|jgi:hypothetical protein
MTCIQAIITEFSNSHDLTPGATVCLINHIFGLIANIGVNAYLDLPQTEQQEFIKDATNNYISSL